MNTRRALTAAAALAAVSLTGCKYVAVGDSVLMQAQDQLKADLGSATEVNAVPGRGPDQNVLGTDTLRKGIIDHLGDVDRPGGTLIVQEAGDHVITPDFVQWVVDYVPDDICVAWVLPHNLNDPAKNEANVEAITSRLPQQPCNKMIRWDQVDTSGVSTDGIHLTPDGVRVYADMIARGVR